jgi:hypothetical protein
MPSQNPETLRRLADAIDFARPPSDPTAREAERVRRERAVMRYLERLADGQTEARLHFNRERFKG